MNFYFFSLPEIVRYILKSLLFEMEIYKMCYLRAHESKEFV